MRRHGTRLVAAGDGQGLALHVLGHFAHQEDVAVVGIDGNGPAAAEVFVHQRGLDAGSQSFVVGDGIHEPLVVIQAVGAVGAAVEGRQGGQQQNKGQTSHSVPPPGAAYFMCRINVFNILSGIELTRLRGGCARPRR